MGDSDTFLELDDQSSDKIPAAIAVKAVAPRSTITAMNRIRFIPFSIHKVVGWYSLTDQSSIMGSKMRKKVVIIGAGIGGLAVANLLAKAGYDVHLYEKEATPGGRAGSKTSKGFTFDTGPSWYLMPEVFAHFYELLGESVDQQLTLKKLSPAYKVFFEHDKPVTITGQLEKDAATFEAIEPGAGQQLKEYVKSSKSVYRLALDHFLYTNFESVTDFLHSSILKKATALPLLLGRPLDRYVSGFIKNSRLKQILEYPMVFLGTSPFSAPSMYSLMSALDFDEGVYYPQGGMYRIIESLVQIGKQLGVHYHFNQRVKRIMVTSAHASGIKLYDGRVIAADIVISNADLHFTETSLLAKHSQTYPEAYWKNKEPGPSALLVYLGVSKKVPQLRHHNLLLVDAWKQNFDAIYRTQTIPEHASLYVSVTSKTDPSVAPKGSENIFILVPLPSDLGLTSKKAESLADHYIQQVEKMTGAKIRDSIVTKTMFKPSDFKDSFYSWRSSMLGQSHILRQSAFFRTPNKSKKVDNLYYVGANTTPGIGLPMCLISAELVYKRLIGDKKGGRVKEVR